MNENGIASLALPRRGKLSACLGALFPRSAGARRRGPNVVDAGLALVGPVFTAALSLRQVRDNLQDFSTAPAERQGAIKGRHRRHV